MNILMHNFMMIFNGHEIINLQQIDYILIICLTSMKH